MPTAPAAIFLCDDDRTIAHLDRYELTLLVARSEPAAIDAIRAHPGVPVLVDVDAFGDWPKALRKVEGIDCHPGPVLGFAPPVRHDLIEGAELFCDEVVFRPAVLRTLPAILDRIATP